MGETAERIVINSTSVWYEFDRAQWEETRSGYVLDCAGADATIAFYSVTAPEGSPDTAWQILPTGRAARARIGPDFFELLCEVNRQPTALRTALEELSNSPGWSRRAAGGDHRDLCCAVSAGEFRIALAPDQSISLETFEPDSVLVLQGTSALSLVAKWLPDLLNHLRLRNPAPPVEGQ